MFIEVTNWVKALCKNMTQSIQCNWTVLSDTNSLMQLRLNKKDRFVDVPRA
jgi:hypothetical protein